MFGTLTDRFEDIFSKLTKKGVLSASEVDDVAAEIRLALLEGDVNLDVVKKILEDIKEAAVGEKVHEALNPAQQVIKIVNQVLCDALGGRTVEISYANNRPTVVLMAGLQGTGKTTTSGKLAKWFKSKGRNPLLVGADLQRPAAVEQLRRLGESLDVPVFSEPSDPVSVAAKAVEQAKSTGRDVVIVDTAGRLSIDAELMAQVTDISSAVDPDYTFLVVDAMAGQDAASVAGLFNEALELDGVILTKLDGDSRGGAALSVKHVVGKPIVFAATGEALDEFDQFHPDRMANRILGMGDALSLIEKAEEAFDEGQAEEAAQKMLEGQFNLHDFLNQMQQIKKMGPISNLVALMPGIPKEVKDAQIDDGQLGKIEAIIYSMTPQEREDPDIIDASRRLRIATGAGANPKNVAALLDQFSQMRKMLKRFGGAGTKKMKASGSKKGKSKKNKKKGSRVTPKGTKTNSGSGPGLMLPGLERVSEKDLGDLAAKLDDI